MSDVKKGRGVTFVDLSILPDVLRKGLFLPDTFEIVEARYASHNRLILTMESACIPVVQDGEQALPELRLLCVREGDQVFIDRVEMGGHAYIDGRQVKIAEKKVIYQREKEEVPTQC